MKIFAFTVNKRYFSIFYHCKELYESLLRGLTKLSEYTKVPLSRVSWGPSKMVGDTAWCEISNIKLQRYTDTGPRPGTRPQARDNGKFDISEIQDNETPLYFYFPESLRRLSLSARWNMPSNLRDRRLQLCLYTKLHREKL